jgi:type II secretory pathway component PulF
MKFNYRAKTEQGETSSGTIEASSKEGALALLQKHGLYVTFIEEFKTSFLIQKIKFLSFKGFVCPDRESRIERNNF